MERLWESRLSSGTSVVERWQFLLKYPAGSELTQSVEVEVGECRGATGLPSQVPSEGPMHPYSRTTGGVPSRAPELTPLPAGCSFLYHCQPADEPVLLWPVVLSLTHEVPEQG